MKQKDETKPAHTTSGIKKIFELSLIHNAWQYITGTEKAKRKIVEQYLNIKNNQKILDIGCGTGVLLNYIKSNVKYVGYDINENYINLAKIKYKDKGEFYCISVNESNIYGNEFDCVVAIGILHHLDDNESEELIKSAKKHLKPDGYLLMVEPCWFNSQNKIEKFIMSQDRGQNIRTQAQYLELLNKYFNKTEAVLRSGMLNIPWTLSITKSYA